jgi:hypothetical protein
LSKALTALAALAASMCVAGCDPALQREANRAPWEDLSFSTGFQCVSIGLYRNDFEDAGGNLPAETTELLLENYESFQVEREPPSSLPPAITADFAWLDDHVPTGLSTAEDLRELETRCIELWNRIDAHTDELYPPLFPSPS